MKTIAAISTAAAPGGIGVIRISGDEARAVGDRVFKSFPARSSVIWRVTRAASDTCMRRTASAR